MAREYPGKRNRRIVSDPRRLGGGIIGPGLEDSHSRASVIIDSENAVLLDHTSVALIDPFKDGKPASEQPWWIMVLEGRINKTTERASVGFIFDEEGAAAIISELIALGSRMGPEVGVRLMAQIDERFRQLEEQDALGFKE